MRTDLKSANDGFALIQDTVLAYCSPSLAPLAPQGDCVTSSTPGPFCRLKFKVQNSAWLLSLLLMHFNAFCKSFCGYRCDSTFGWQTLTSKKSDRLCSQKPRARISNLASCAKLALLLSCFPLMSSTLTWSGGDPEISERGGRVSHPQWKLYFSGRAAYSIVSVVVMQSRVTLTFRKTELKNIL